ncbi:hypothetical protein BGY98DRAFT_61675 [Russula aff. rugulosa BPL654]|nr:hypothetical protein BGY98DRAFT_61675 [Russula aff. rugulosa BPL654]
MIKSLFVVGVTGTVLGSSDVNMSPQAKEEECCSAAAGAKTEEARNRHLITTCHVLLLSSEATDHHTATITHSSTCDAYVAMLK